MCTYLTEKLDVEDVPTIVLVKGRHAVGRLEGRVTGGEIEEMIRSNVA